MYGKTEPLEEEERMTRIVHAARQRASRPLFEEEYSGIDYSIVDVGRSPSTLDENGRDLVLDNTHAPCTDSVVPFILGDENRTCNDLVSMNLMFGCTQDRIVEYCPDTCGVCNATTATTKTTSTDSGNNHTVAPTSSSSGYGSSSPSHAPTASPSDVPIDAAIWNPFSPKIIRSIYFY